MAAVRLLLLCLAAISSSYVADATVRVYGERYRHPKYKSEYMLAFTDMPLSHDSSTTPTAVGVIFTKKFLSYSTQLPGMETTMLPLGPGVMFNSTATEGSINFPCVGANPFKFLYWSFNANGHPPPGVYDVPHYDLHFLFHDQDEYWSKWYPPSSHGPCDGVSKDTLYRIFKPLHSDCFPGGGDPRLAQFGPWWGMGCHVGNVTGAEWVPAPHQFDHTLIYGQDNGEITYLEPMVAVKYLLKPGTKKCFPIYDNPKRMNTARKLPRQYCIEAKGNTVEVSFKSFYNVPGGCSSSKAPLVGYYNAPAPLTPGCKVPTKP